MDVFSNLAMGFDVVFTTTNLFYCLIGALVGTIVGILPGIGPLTTIAVLLPLTYQLGPLPSIIMLSGIYYGAHHAGSTTAIMLNMPGEPSSVIVCLDGYPLARQGRAGPALCISAVSSFFAGVVSVLIVALFSPPLAAFALQFGPAEYFAVVLSALVATSALSSRPFNITMAMTVLGVLLSTVGTDVISGERRLTMGVTDLIGGIDFSVLAVALFAFAEITAEANRPDRSILGTRIGRFLPTRADLATAASPILRGTALGSLLGILPGTGPMVSSFAAYTLEKRIAKDPSVFGKGAIQGVAGPEAAANAAAFTHFIPMLTLGIPAGAAMALMLGALQIQGISPGPQVMVKHPELFWGVVASMLVGNAMLIILNLPMVGLWIRLLSIPYRIMFPAILVLCSIGVYTLNNSTFDVVLAGVLAFAGFVLLKLDCPPAPLVVGFVLGPILEVNFRRSLVISQGDLSIFIERPISLAFLIVSIALLVAISTPLLRRARTQAPT